MDRSRRDKGSPSRCRTAPTCRTGPLLPPPHRLPARSERTSGRRGRGGAAPRAGLGAAEYRGLMRPRLPPAGNRGGAPCAERLSGGAAGAVPRARRRRWTPPCMRALRCASGVATGGGAQSTAATVAKAHVIAPAPLEPSRVLQARSSPRLRDGGQVLPPSTVSTNLRAVSGAGAHDEGLHACIMGRNGLPPTDCSISGAGAAREMRPSPFQPLRVQHDGHGASGPPAAGFARGGADMAVLLAGTG